MPTVDLEALWYRPTSVGASDIKCLNGSRAQEFYQARNMFGSHDHLQARSKRELGASIFNALANHGARHIHFMLNALTRLKAYFLVMAPTSLSKKWANNADVYNFSPSFAYFVTHHPNHPRQEVFRSLA